MSNKNSVSTIWKNHISKMLSKHFRYKSVRQLPSEWVEENIILTAEVSRYDGKFSYDLSPYAKEIIDNLHPTNPSRYIAVMKSAQSGITQGCIVPGMAWIIAEHPDNFLFTAGDMDLAKKTIVQRFDPMIRSSGLKHFIRPNVVREAGKRSGDTDFSKEFAGGSAIVKSTGDANSFRFFSVKTCFLDDFDTAPKADKKEGSTRKLIDGRQTSYGNLAKTYYVSTPTITQTSNIYETYLLGDQRKWHWPCNNCGEFVPSDWRMEMYDGSGFAGIVWELDDNKKLIEDSVAFKCPCCGHKMTNTDKHEINLKGKWIPTAEAKERNFVSYYMNSLIIPPGFTTWVDLVYEWLEACPPGEKVKVDLLKVFNNVRLGLPFKEKGETVKVMALMNNTNSVSCGVIPDVQCESDGNGDICLITLAADLGGVMKDDNEDVRIDWEIVAHSSTGATYSIDHGSIGSFKRTRAKRSKDVELDKTRKKLTYNHNVENSAWNPLREIIERDYVGQSGEEYNIQLSLIDTGHFTTAAYEFINSFVSSDRLVLGVKGVPESKFRRNTVDKAPVRKSSSKNNLYLLDVEQLKDDLASYIKLKKGSDGSQGDGYMNFPQPEKGKYQMKTFFKHYESEVRREVMEKGESVGFKWEKKNSSVENHFWDVRVYNVAARHIYLDVLKRTSPTEFKGLDWATFVEFVIN